MGGNAYLLSRQVSSYGFPLRVLLRDTFVNKPYSYLPLPYFQPVEKSISTQVLVRSDRSFATPRPSVRSFVRSFVRLFVRLSGV